MTGKNFENSRKYLPLVIGFLILAVMAFFVPWQDVVDRLFRLTPMTLAMLVGLSLVYFYGKVLRYWLMLRMLDVKVSISKVALACMVAQPVSVLPAGELYRGAMLKRYANVSISKGSPTVVTQAIVEAIGLLLVALVGAAVLRQGMLPITVVASGLILVVVGIKKNQINLSQKILNKIPGISVTRSKLKVFLSSNQTLLHRYNFFTLLAASFITTLAGVGIIFVAARGLGVQLSLFQAAISYALPVVLGAVSFLPGGIGASEQGLVGMLALFGVGISPAVAITLIMRTFTLGVGFVYGFLALLYAKAARVKEYS